MDQIKSKADFKLIFSYFNSFYLGFLYSILLFFMIWTFQPEEIMHGSENNELKYIVACLALAIMIAYIIGRSLDNYHKLNTISLVIVLSVVIVTATIVLISFTSFVSTTWEWWITQSAWFIRLYSWNIGVYLGSIIIFTILLSIQKIKEWGSLEKEKQVSHISVLIGSVMINFALINWIFNPYGLFFVIVYHLVASGIVLLVYLVWVLKNNEIYDDAYKKEVREEIYAKSQENQSRLGHFLSKMDIHDKIMIFAMIIQAVLLIFLIDDSYNAAGTFIIPLPIFAGVLFIFIWSIASKNKRTNIWSKPNVINSDKLIVSFFKKPIPIIKEQIGIFFVSLFELLRLIVPFLAIGCMWYRFRTVFYLPNFLFRLCLFGIIGVFIYKKTRSIKKYQLIFYSIFCIGMLFLTFILNYDVTHNAYSYYGMDFDLIFPFQFLLSNLHALIIGCATGFILSYEFNRIIFRYSDESNLIVRAIILPLIFLLLGVILIALSIINVPGGGVAWTPAFGGYDDPPFIPNPFLEEEYLYPFIFTLVLIVLIVFLDYLIPKIISNRKLSSNLTRTQWSFKFIPITIKSRPFNVKKTVMISIILCSILPISVFFIGNTIKDNLSLPLMASNSAVDVFAAPGDIRIGSKQVITRSNQKSDIIYNLSLAGNEYESIQLILKPKGRTINGLRYTFEEFKHSDGYTLIDRSYISVRYADNLYEDTMPERLIDLNAINLIEARNHIIWITIGAPYEAKPGYYNTTFNFTYGNLESFAVSIGLNVWNFSVPQMRHLRSNFGPQTENWNMINTFASHRINTYGIPIYSTNNPSEFATNPKITCYYNEVTEEWEFHWTWWDTQTELSLNKGLNGFYIGCPLGMPREPVWLESDNVTISEWGIIYRKFYEGVQAHLEFKRDNEGKDWFKYAYIYFIDEFQMFVPEGWTRQAYWDALEKFMILLKTAAPDLKIMTTTPPSYELLQLEPYIDIYCPISSDYNKTEWDHQREIGKEMWMYACVGPRAPWPNSHYYNRLFEIRVLYWQVWHYKLHGFLYWSTTPYYHGKYGIGFNAWGDAWYLYEKESGLVDDTIRWENWRDAAEDYEYIWLMNATIQAMGGDPDSQNLLNSLVNSIVGDTYTYCNNPNIIRNARSQIGQWLSDVNSEGIYDVMAIGEAEWIPTP